MRASATFRVILHRKNRRIFIAQALNRAIKKIAMGYRGDFGDGFWDIVIVVLASDFYCVCL